MSKISYANFLKFLVGNLDKLDDLMQLAADFASAVTLEARWEIIYEIGKLFLAAKETADQDAVTAFQADDIAALESQINAKLAETGYAAQAWDGTRLRKLFDTLLPVLIQILPVLIK